MRWPSVYCWGWFMGIPGLLLCFIGSVAMAVGEMALVLRSFGSTGVPFVAYFGVTLFVLLFASHKLVDCPRCGTSAFLRSRTHLNNAWPVKHCSKCDLDLRKYHPFDSRAKRGT